MLRAVAADDSSTPSSFCKMLKGSGASGIVVEFFSAEPFGFLAEDSKDVVDSLDTRDKEEDRGLKPGLCAAVLGAR